MHPIGDSVKGADDKQSAVGCEFELDQHLWDSCRCSSDARELKVI